MSQAVPTLRTRLRFALCILLVVGTSVSAALADVGVPPVRPARMVLQSRDVGSAYIQNKRFSRPRTLADAGNGDSQSIRRRLGQIWIGGYQTGFNGRRVPWGVVSTIDVFRTSRLADVERTLIALREVLSTIKS